MNRCFFVSLFLAIYVSNQYEVTAKPTIKIVNGTTAEEGEFPYVVQLRDHLGYFVCGGSIIDEEWILTAGHCVEDLGSGSTVIYGTTKLYDIGDPAPNTSIAVKKSYQHPKFRYNSFDVPEYDVGILELAEKIPFTKYIHPIRLGGNDTNIPIHIEGVLTGWGGYDHNGDLPSYLQKIYLHFLTDDECTQKINDYGGDEVFNSTHNLCTNDYYNGGCYGDSGSPFIINSIQYGLISWSLKPCYGVVPNTYSRITNPEYRNWIKNITNI